MRFWITKNSELPVREQLVRQIMLGILSEDLPAGHKLASIRAFARQHHIHSNTVSAAYHDLLDRGWLELRRGSGLYVRPLKNAGSGTDGLDTLLAALLRAAHSAGHEPDEVLQRLQHMILPRKCARIVVVESEPGMRQILQAEIREHLSTPVDAIEPCGLSKISNLGACQVAALTTRVFEVRKQLPQNISCLSLRLRSVRASLEMQKAPAPNKVISIASKSPEFRHAARVMLIAVGIEPDRLCEIDANIQNWQKRIGAGAMVITDVVAARDIPSACDAKVFRVIADSSIAEMKQFCTD
jgi:DNA-binding transcriptional regulator YhcF (GntR family)